MINIGLEQYGSSLERKNKEKKESLNHLIIKSYAENSTPLPG